MYQGNEVAAKMLMSSVLVVVTSKESHLKADWCVRDDDLLFQIVVPTSSKGWLHGNIGFGNGANTGLHASQTPCTAISIEQAHSDIDSGVFPPGTGTVVPKADLFLKHLPVGLS